MDVKFVMNDDNKENNGGTETSDYEDSSRRTKRKRNTTKETGVSVLRKIITPELRTDKKKKVQQQIPHKTSERDREMKEELHEIRIKILRKELEIKENQFFTELEINTERLKAAKAESEMRILQKQIKGAKLEKLQND